MKLRFAVYVANFTYQIPVGALDEVDPFILLGLFLLLLLQVIASEHKVIIYLYV